MARAKRRSARGAAGRGTRPKIYAQELVGAVLDVTYDDPPATYRVNVVGYDARQGLHRIESKGFPTWDGKEFADVVHANALLAQGRARIVNMDSSAAAPSDGRAFGDELVGEVLAVRYPEGEFAVRVTGYDPARRWHDVSSVGLSLWDGEDFTDELDVAAMYAEGKLRLLGRVAGADAAAGSASSSSSTLRQRPAASPAASPQLPFGDDLVGRVVDVVLPDPPGEHRLRVVAFDVKQGLHKVASVGVDGNGEGEAFAGAVELDAMLADGRAQLLQADGTYAAVEEEAAGRRGAAVGRGGGESEEPPPKASAPRRAPQRSPPTPAASSTGPRRRAAPTKVYAQELIGTVLEVEYDDPPAMYTVRVVGYDARQGLHRIESKGFPTWDGEELADVVNANALLAQGRARIVGTGGRPGRAQPPPPPRQPPASRRQTFGKELIGEVLAVRYPEGEFTVRVIDYDPINGWHIASSAGLSLWDGEDFTDELNVAEMHAAGELRLLGRGAGADAAAGSSSSGRPRRAATAPLPAGPRPPFGSDIMGRVVDVVYLEPPGEFRMQVVAFNKKTGFHSVVSHGELGLWDGETFEDILNLNSMCAEKRVRFVLDAGDSEAATAVRAKPVTRGRGARRRIRFSVQPKRRPAPPRPPPPTSGSQPLPPGAPRGRPPAVCPAAPPPGHRPVALPHPEDVRFGADICGHILDVLLPSLSLKRRFRVRVLKYDEEHGMHTVSSRGLSLWKGKDFLEEVDINGLYSEGHVSFASSRIPPSGVVPEAPRGRGGRFSEHAPAAGAGAVAARAASFSGPARGAGRGAARARGFGAPERSRSRDRRAAARAERNA